MVLEASNIFMLYFVPNTKKGNGIGVLNSYKESKSYLGVHALIQYPINWIDRTKTIFIALLLVILINGEKTTKLYAVIALIISILTSFWRLYPSIKSMDKANQISPKGYSKTLAIMIAIFVLVFSTTLIISIFL